MKAFSQDSSTGITGEIAETVAGRQIDRALARAIHLEPLGDEFDAAVMARIEALPRQAAGQRARALDASQRAMALNTTRALLEQEQRAMRVRVAIYATAAALLFAMLVHVIGLISGSSLDRLASLPIVLGDPRAWALPSAALAVLVSGAWLFARDRHLGVI